MRYFTQPADELLMTVALPILSSHLTEEYISSSGTFR